MIESQAFVRWIQVWLTAYRGVRGWDVLVGWRRQHFVHAMDDLEVVSVMGFWCTLFRVLDESGWCRTSVMELQSSAMQAAQAICMGWLEDVGRSSANLRTGRTVWTLCILNASSLRRRLRDETTGGGEAAALLEKKCSVRASIVKMYPWHSHTGRRLAGSRSDVSVAPWPMLADLVMQARTVARI